MRTDTTIHREAKKVQYPKTTTPNKSPAPLSADLEKSLAVYAYAATAAGVGLLTLAQPAEARIVYTHTNTSIPVNAGMVPLDLNHDGVADFSVSNWSYVFNCCFGTIVQLAEVAPNNPANAIWGLGSFSFSFQGFKGKFASALRSGLTVGPNRARLHRRRQGLLGFYLYNFIYPVSSKTYGQWLQTRGRYLGFRFLIDGQVHYGWARLRVLGPHRGDVLHGLNVTLTGYAYETIPNKPIVTGQTKGAEIVDEPLQPISQTAPPATLGMLALGFPGYRFGREMNRSLTQKVRINNQITSGGK